DPGERAYRFGVEQAGSTREGAFPQHELREPREVGRAGEQARVTRDAAEPRRVLVIDHAAHRVAPPHPGGGGAPPEIARRPEHRRPHPEGTEDLVRREDVERTTPPRPAADLAAQDRVETGVLQA